MGFPCNQFANQEPGEGEEIQSFCTINYGVSFPIHRKIEVKGEGADPLYRFLTQRAPGLLGSKAIKWNFTKFLVDRAGEKIERFAPTTTPEKLDAIVARRLAKE